MTALAAPPRKLVIGPQLGQDAIERIRLLAPDTHVVRTDRLRPDPDLASADAVWFGQGEVDGEQLLEIAPGLRWLQTFGAGVERWLTPRFVESDVVLTNTSGIHGIQIAEHVLALMLAFARGLPRLVQSQRHQALHHPRLDQFELAGQTLVIVGFGRIGQALALRAAALGLTVIGVKRHNAPPPEGVTAIVGSEDVDRALALADHVVAALPLTANTRHFFDERRFAQFKRGAYFYNVGRGGSVDHAALLGALTHGRLAGAGLDVTDPEPLPPHHPLRRSEKVILTVHTAGASPRYFDRALAVALDNLKRLRQGRPLVNVVDKRAGY
ncbi:D-2-hydroxyacid dehydrogenase [Chitiniphilus eburneus]|nr:D-2-hydroxyacid dehydrogenase [Chitiniphilus eburneus]